MMTQLELWMTLNQCHPHSVDLRCFNTTHEHELCILMISLSATLICYCSILIDSTTSITPSTTDTDFDPIAFLNQHYETEHQLITALPSLRTAISSRLTHLDDSLSTTLRHQAALAPMIAQDVMHARNAVLQLATRIKDVKEQAQKSEEAVLQITKDMKRLDYAKRHLQRTITALKRLHMLLHATEQLRVATVITERQVVPNYKVASHLIDATRLLLGHFEGYMGSVPKMRQVRDAVGVLRSQLRQGIIKLFDEVGFPEEHNQRVTRNDDFDENPEENATSSLGLTASPPSALVQSTLADACLVIEALGPESKEEFIAKFVSDHLEEYEQTFNPSPAASAKNKSEPKSFKKDNSKESDAINPMSIDQVDKRFAWYRDFLRSLQVKFGNVFPPHWSMYYRLTASFLERTARHLKFVLKKNGTTIRVVPFTAAPSSGSGASSLVSAKFSATITGASTHGISSSSTHGGSGAGESSAADGEKAVTALLKALQQTILFEKEMSAWLARDYGTKFLPEASEKKRADDEDALEFDDQGKAVAAGSAEGIRIKYERKKKSGGADAHINGRETGGEQVKPLIGIASVVFDNHMSPYVQLEERTMDEQLHNAQSDNTVDTRGDRPVFVSSTNLFIYMKNSITRCTALTKEKTFFLLQRAFQKKLRDYAKVLEKKLPQPQSQNVAKLALANIQAGGTTTGQASTIYRIPPGEEITICHVIDTCEYCADTVEALEDLIRDKIGAKYKEKVDMSEDQEAFQDVTAKSIRVLVSGLEQRLDTPLKEISKTNWLSFDMVGEESSYVRAIHLTIHPFVTQVRELIPSSYFRSFCDKFATAFASTYYRTLIGLKRISEAGTQQLLLDVYSMKTLLLKLPVLESSKKVPGTRSATTAPSKSLSGGSTIAPAIYTKMVNKDFRKLEVMLKLVGSPKEMLIDMFRAQWDCSIDTNAMAADFQTIMTLKGIPRNEQPALLENLGLEGGDGAVDGSSTMTANMQALQEKGSDVAAKVNADLSQMRARVDDFRKAFR